MAVLWYQWLCIVAVMALATPLPLHENNYSSLSGLQVWQTEGDFKIAEVISELERQGVADILGHSNGAAVLGVFPESRELTSTALRRAGITYRVVIPDLAHHIANEARLVRRDAPNPTQGETCFNNSCPEPLHNKYMKFEEMEWYLQELAAKSPRVELKSIGKSVEGRDIWRVHIKSKAGETQERRAVWLEGGIHAREWISPAVTLHLIRLFVDAHSTTSVKPDFDVYVVPMANPDGYVYTWTTNRLWRKNRRLSKKKPGCNGVDLNRNWVKGYGIGASTNPCSVIYMGTKPFSEPETQALMEEMQRVASKKKLEVVIALHSYGQALLYPWGWTRDEAPNTKEMKEAGNAFAKAAAETKGTKYEVNSSSSWGYVASGATDDWAKAELGIPYSYTLELPDKGFSGFGLPADNILPVAKEVWNGLQKLLEYVEETKL